MGNLFVGRLHFAESLMKDDPLTPMHGSNLMRLLKPQVALPVGLVDRLMVARARCECSQRLMTWASRACSIS